MTVAQFTRIFFRDTKSYKLIDEKEKEKMFFMFNRMIARLYPINANRLNYNGIDTGLALDVWFHALSPRFTDIPNRLQPNWATLKKSGSNSLLNKFSETDRKILELYPELLEEASNIDKEEKKLSKEGSIKITKKRVSNKK